MGMTHADIELINWSDLDRVKRFEIDQDEIRRPDHPDGAMFRIPTLLPADRIPWLVRNQLRGFLPG